MNIYVECIKYADAQFDKINKSRIFVLARHAVLEGWTSPVHRQAPEIIDPGFLNNFADYYY
jgi:hypothetical protein